MKIAERVENNVRKGETARYEQFLLFSHCFQLQIPTNKGWFEKGLSAIFGYHAPVYGNSDVLIVLVK